MDGTDGISAAQPGGNHPQNVGKPVKSEGRMEGYTVSYQPATPPDIDSSPLENIQIAPMKEPEKDHSFTKVDKEGLEQRGGEKSSKIKDPALQTDAIKQKILAGAPNTDEAQRGGDYKREGETPVTNSEGAESSSDWTVDTNEQAGEIGDLEGGFEMFGDIIDALGIDDAEKEGLQVKEAASDYFLRVQKSLNENPEVLDVVFTTPEGNIECVPAAEVLKDPQKYKNLKIIGLYNKEEKTLTLIHSKHQEILFGLFIECKAKPSEHEGTFDKEDEHDFSTGHKLNHPTTSDSDNKNIHSKKEAGDKLREKADTLDREIQKNSLEKEATDQINLKKHLKNRKEQEFDQKQERIKKSEIQKRKNHPPL